MLEFIVDFRDVTKMFHNHRVVKAWLQELKKTTNSRVLVRPAPTRWETIQQMCQRLLDSESHLDTISSARNFIKGTAAQQAERQKVKDIITDDQFVVKLKKALAIMIPLDRLIVKYQSDKVPISEVMPNFHALPKEFKTLLGFHIITQSEFEYLFSVAHARFLFLYETAHGLLYLLDSFLLGEGLPPDIRNDLETALFEIPVDNVIPSSDERKDIIYMQYTNYVIAATREKTHDTPRYKMLKKGSKSLMQY
ncbi:hypothetical protein BASA62_000076 [Batrachochytrium salamandrivorans]|nr:hypothetical protein BASA62_000076 [Batrachochytrium salamandrivorans]